MAPTDDVGRAIVIDFGRESISQPMLDEGERRPDQWQPIREPLQRVIKRSIVAGGLSGAISRKHARRLMVRLHLRSV